MFKFISSVLFCLFFSTCVADDFIVGTASGYAPYVSLNEKGEYVGFDVDIAQAVADQLGRKLVLKDLGSLPALSLCLKKSKIDAIIWAISITEERKKQMDMIYYQGDEITSLPLLFWKEIPSNIQSIEDMTNDPSAVISVEAGSFQENFLLSVPGLNLKQVDKVTDAILELKYGKSKAVILDPVLLANILKKFPEIKVLNIPLPISSQVAGNGICINKSNKTLSDEVQKAVDYLRESGKIAELEAKWNLGRS